MKGQCPLFLPTNYEQFLLVCGWSKHNTKSNIPKAISHLFFKFYNVNICMVFKGEKLNQFLSQKCASAFLSRIITYQSMKFQCRIASGSKVWFSVIIKSKPNNIKFVTFRTKMCSPQTNTQYQLTQRKNMKSESYDNSLVKWDEDTLTLSECKNIAKDHARLEFLCNIDILNIEYDDGTKYIQQGIKMKKSSQIIWELTKNDWDAAYADYQIVPGPMDMDECWNIGLERRPLWARDSLNRNYGYRLYVRLLKCHK